MSYQKKFAVPSFLPASCLIAAALFFLVSGAGAASLEQEPPARMVPVCLAHMDAAIAQLQDPDRAEAEKLYRAREVFRHWIGRHPASAAGTDTAARNAAETSEEADFCRHIGAVMFQFAEPADSAAIIRQAETARLTDAANAGRRGSPK